MQLHFHISRHIAHLGWETPVFFTLFTLSTYGTVVSVLTIQSSISQFEFLFEQLSTIKLFQCFHIQMIVVPFLRNNPSAVMFFQRFI
jgi:hypothetical protein